MRGAHRSSASNAPADTSEDPRDSFDCRAAHSRPRHDLTTYEGSWMDDLSYARRDKTGGFSRSNFVTSRRCSENELKSRYCIGEEMGSGATSRVYRAVNTRTGEDVAVKIILKAHVKDHQMLQSEIQIHKDTDHPNILRLLEVFEDDVCLYLVTEICQGGDLGKLLNTRGDEYSAVVIPEDDALRLVQQIVNSVQYLHQKGIVHRDLKPGNFLCSVRKSSRDAEPSETVASTRVLKLADFGVSAYCPDKHRLTRRVGTDGFMAPEIIRNQPYNEKADIFSIGCLLHMMLTGHPPKQRESGAYVTSKIRLKFVSGEMRALIDSCLSPNPGDRPSAQEIYMLPLLQRTRQKDWVNSARLDAHLLDKMYAYSSFPLLKKAALVAMVSRAESDSNFLNCIEKFMSLEDGTSQGVLTVEEIHRTLYDELVVDMARKADRLVNGDSLAARLRGRRRPPGLGGLEPLGMPKFRQELLGIAKDLVHKIDPDGQHRITYSEWLAATIEPSWYTDGRRIKATFRLFDADGDGVISPDDLRSVIPRAFRTLDVHEVLLESQHCSTQSVAGVREKDFVLLLRTHKPSKFTLTRIRDGLEDVLLPSRESTAI